VKVDGADVHYSVGTTKSPDAAKKHVEARRVAREEAAKAASEA
jgi:hypothetical protein